MNPDPPRITTRRAEASVLCEFWVTHRFYVELEGRWNNPPAVLLSAFFDIDSEVSLARRSGIRRVGARQSAYRCENTRLRSAPAMNQRYWAAVAILEKKFTVRQQGVAQQAYKRATVFLQAPTSPVTAARHYKGPRG